MHLLIMSTDIKLSKAQISKIIESNLKEKQVEKELREQEKDLLYSFRTKI